MKDNYEKSLDFYYDGRETYEQGDYEQALMLFQNSLRLYEHSRTHARIYECLIALDKRKEALPYIQKAYQQNENHDRVALQYAGELVNALKMEEANIILKKVLQRNKTYQPALRMLEKCNKED